MLKIIIYNNNLEQVKNLCNNLVNIFENLQVVGIATSEQELYSLFKKTNANIAIVKFEDVNNTQMKKILNLFDMKIIFHNNLKHLKNNSNTIYIRNSKNYIEIEKQFSDFIYKINEPIIYQKTLDILKKLNFNFKLKGTSFLLNCITYSYLHKEKYVSDNLEKNVYPQIAKQFNVTLSSVKWSIIRAINDVNFYSDNKNSLNYKLTPKSLINEIINKLN